MINSHPNQQRTQSILLQKQQGKIKKSKSQIPLFLLTGAAVIITSPALAFFSINLDDIGLDSLGIPGELNLPGTTIKIDLNPYFNELKGFALEEINQVVSSLGLDPTTVNVINEVLGKLGLPDLQQLAQNVYGQITSPSQNTATNSSLIVNPVILANQQATDTVLAIEKQILAAKLGQNSQEQIAKQIESVASLTASASQAAQTAASKNITQDILKEITVQNAQASLILQAIYRQSLDNHLGNTQMHLTLTEVANSLKTEERERLIQQSGEQLALFRSMSNFTTLVGTSSVKTQVKSPF